MAPQKQHADGKDTAADFAASPVKLSALARVVDVLFVVAVFPLTVAGHLLLLLYFLGVVVFARLGGPRLVGSGVSITARTVCAARHLAHSTGVGSDTLAPLVARQLPGFYAVYPLAFLSWLRWRIGGPLRAPRLWPLSKFMFYIDEIVPVLHGRTEFFDALFASKLAEVEQVVILGAGLDTRAYRLPTQGSDVAWFEVDAPHMIELRNKIFRKLKPTACSSVTRVPVLFDQKDWEEELTANGYRRDKPTLFLIEGVLNYLTREDAEATLRKTSLAHPKSLIAFTCMLSLGQDGHNLHDERFLKPIKESHRFFLPRGQHEAFCGSLGLGVTQFVDLPEIMAKVPDRMQGSRRHFSGGYCLVVAQPTHQ